MVTRRGGAVVGRRDPRRRVSVSPTMAERAKINAVGLNRMTTAVARVARPYQRVTAAVARVARPYQRVTAAEGAQTFQTSNFAFI